MELTYHFRYCIPIIHRACGDAGLPVFMVIISHFNIRSRCYPSYDTLQYYTEFSRQAVSDAVAGLIEIGMLRIVPSSERVEDEKKVRSNVYEGTGVLKVGNIVIPYANFDWLSAGVEASEANEIRAFVATVKKLESSSKTGRGVFQLDSKRIQRNIKRKEKQINHKE